MRPGRPRATFPYMSRRRGQASVEYLLLLCSMVMVAGIVGNFLIRYSDLVVQRIEREMSDAVSTLLFG